MPQLKAIVGLGNPGDQYVRTRHNVGFSVLDLVAERAGESFELDSKWEARTCKIGGVTYLQPQTFMNESGRSIGSISRFYRWAPEEILVVFDDISLPLGSLRFRMNGGHGGHNGVRSLLEHLPGDDFSRLKFGIGGSSGDQLTGHVLGTFAMDEKELLQNTLATAADAVQLAASVGVETAANQFNVKSKTKKTNLEQIPPDESQIRGDDRPQHPGE
ncbi:aminoacyl-tRNA hydrolase [bacterium]|nr:aminoacyl-tRNA hydrolase [bacterium]MDB4781639.1 aminoacyl-tRNA hydrolase [Akkermansiaceae bacterium]